MFGYVTGSDIAFGSNGRNPTKECEVIFEWESQKAEPTHGLDHVWAAGRKLAAQ